METEKIKQRQLLDSMIPQSNVVKVKVKKAYRKNGQHQSGHIEDLLELLDIVLNSECRGSVKRLGNAIQDYGSQVSKFKRNVNELYQKGYSKT